MKGRNVKEAGLREREGAREVEDGYGRKDRDV